MFPTQPKPSFYILGLTERWQVFRPSDWAERLAGIMAQFRESDRLAAEQGASASLAASAAYSPLVLPVHVDHPDPKVGGTVRAVRVIGRLHEVEPMAYAFLRQFAADNQLQVLEQQDSTTEGID